MFNFTQTSEFIGIFTTFTFTAIFKIFFHPEFNESDSVLDQPTPSLTPPSHCSSAQPLRSKALADFSLRVLKACVVRKWRLRLWFPVLFSVPVLLLWHFSPPLFRYPWSADLHGPGVQAGSWCVAPEGGPQREQSLQWPLQHHAHRGAQPVPRHSTKGRVAHEPSRRAGFHPPGMETLRIYNHGNW